MFLIPINERILRNFKKSENLQFNINKPFFKQIEFIISLTNLKLSILIKLQ